MPRPWPRPGDASAPHRVRHRVERRQVGPGRSSEHHLRHRGAPAARPCGVSYPPAQPDSSPRRGRSRRPRSARTISPSRTVPAGPLPPRAHRESIQWPVTWPVRDGQPVQLEHRLTWASRTLETECAVVGPVARPAEPAPAPLCDQHHRRCGVLHLTKIGTVQHDHGQVSVPGPYSRLDMVTSCMAVTQTISQARCRAGASGSATVRTAVIAAAPLARGQFSQAEVDQERQTAAGDRRPRAWPGRRARSRSECPPASARN